MGDIGSAFSSGLSDLGGSASSALSGMGSLFSGLMGGGSSAGGSSAGGGGSAAPQSQPTPAQTQPPVSPQASQAMSVNPPTLPTNDQSGTQQNQNQGRTIPPVPMVPPSTIADIIKGLGLAAPEGINPWTAAIGAAGAATATPAETGEARPQDWTSPTQSGGSTTNLDPTSTPYGPPSTAGNVPIGGGAGNVQEAPTNRTAAGEPRVDPNNPPIPPPRPASAAPSAPDGGAGGAAAPSAGGGGGDANIPAVASTPASADAPAAGAGGQPDMGQLFQQIIMPLLGAAMGGGGGGPMGGILGLAMQALGGGMGGNMPSPFAGPMAGMWGRRGFGPGRFGGRGGFMIPGRGFGGQGRGGMWPYWHPNFGWRMHNAHPGGLWQPHPGGMGGGMAGRNWAANRYGGGIPGVGGPGAGGARQTPDGSPPNGARAGAEAAKGGGATSSVDGVPPSVLNQARQVALQTRGDPRAVADFMRRQGFPEHAGAWCGDFAASVVHAAGGTPPAGSAVAGNWANYGTPRQGPPQQGDIAMIRGWDPRTGMGVSHVTIVDSVNPDGTFTGLGGNQGGGQLKRSRFPISSGIFRVPPPGAVAAGGAPAGGGAMTPASNTTGGDGDGSDGIFSQLSPTAFDEPQGDQTAASP